MSKLHSNLFGTCQAFGICAVLVVVSLGKPISSFGNEGLEDFDTAIAEKDITCAVEKFCKGVNLGTVYSANALKSLKGEELTAAKAELSKARQLLKNLSVLTTCLLQSKVSTNDKVKIIQQLAVLKKQVQQEEKLGAGNVELSCAISMLVSGLFFEVFDEADENSKNILLSVFEEKSRHEDVDLLLKILQMEAVPIPAKKGMSTYDFLIHLTKGTNEAGMLGTDSMPSSDLGVLAYKLQRQLAHRHFSNLLTRFHTDWFVWDIFLTTRIESMCRLTPLIKPKMSKGSYEQLQKAISTNLSEFEQKALFAVSTTNSSTLQRNSTIWIDIKEHLSSKGNRILQMLRHRLDSTK